MPTMAGADHAVKNVRSLNSSRHTSKFSAAGAAVVGGTAYSGLQAKANELEGAASRTQVNMQDIAN